jgi:hypothetical protein
MGRLDRTDDDEGHLFRWPVNGVSRWFLYFGGRVTQVFDVGTTRDDVRREIEASGLVLHPDDSVSAAPFQAAGAGRLAEPVAAHPG